MDALGDRMKMYEGMETNRRAIPGLPVLIRIDGRGFSRWTRDLEYPFDPRLQELRVRTTMSLMQDLGAIFGYCQSDEISLVLWAQNPMKQSLFSDGKFQKLVSLSASMTTAYFNNFVSEILPEKLGKIAMFDSRVWQVPSKEEAVNAILWRELDASKNSISQAARSVYSPNQIFGKNSSELQDMLFQKGINWNDYPTWAKRGSCIARVKEKIVINEDSIQDYPEKSNLKIGDEIIRSRLKVLELPTLSKIKNIVDVVFSNAIPSMT
jgi:tRNA(His) 5'-end guanylyltransferase